MGDFTLIAKTLAGLEDALAAELAKLGGRNIQKARRAVIFNGDKLMLYRANYNLRTALRILRQVSAFRFNSTDDFYTHCRSVNWEGLMHRGNTFAVYSTVYHSKQFRNSMFASLKVKDAVADYFRGKTGIRPNVDTTNPDVIINAHISHNNCTLSLDSSGESLHKRGYRVAQTKAPLNEVLAAGMILISGWDGTNDFIDPMCGSGTLPAEAVLIASNTAPGSFRQEFAFKKWADFDNLILKTVINEHNTKKFDGKVYASDISERNVGMAKANARNAGIFKNITFSISDFRNLNIPTKNATIIMNPPYGERLKPDKPEELYSMLGERLKHAYAGNNAWILSSSKEYFQEIGLKHSERHELYNGAIKCEFRKYVLFPGKRKD